MRKPIILIAAAALLAGCGGSTSTTAKTPSARPSSSLPSVATTGAAPTAEQTAWAGKVCAAATMLKKEAEGLSSAATSGGTDVSATLSAQVATIKAAADGLAATVTAVPAGSESDPEIAALKGSADQFKESIAALESSVAALEGKSGSARATALASAGVATAASLSALGAATQAITDAAKDVKSTLGRAFEAAPSCNSLTL